MRVTYSPTAMVMEDEGERKMEADSTDVLFVNNSLRPRPVLGTCAFHI